MAHKSQSKAPRYQATSAHLESGRWFEKLKTKQLHNQITLILIGYIGGRSYTALCAIPSDKLATCTRSRLFLGHGFVRICSLAGLRARGDSNRQQ